MNKSNETYVEVNSKINPKQISCNSWKLSYVSKNLFWVEQKKNLL